MQNIKNYREKELNNYVIGNILLIFYFSKSFSSIFYQENVSFSLLFKAFVESGFVISIIYIYVFLFDSMIPSDIKIKIAYLHLGKLPGFIIFTKMKESVRDIRFTKEDAMDKYKNIYDNMPKDQKNKERYENIEWYKIYSSYKKEEKIRISNREFLLCRDINLMTISLLIMYALFVGLKALEFSKIIIAILIMEFIVSNIAMRANANRLAYNVISEDIHRHDI